MAIWIGIIVISWVALSVVVSLALGGMIRLADARRVPSAVRAERSHPRPGAPQPPLRRVS